MPNFTDYLFAPWKLISLLFSGPPSASPEAVASPAQSGLCFFKDVGGGQMLHVCRIAGYEMPNFVFVASLLILTVFVVSSLLLCRQCLSVSRALAWVSDQLKRNPEAQGTSNLQFLSQLMLKSELTALPWRNFEDSLLVSTQGGETFATQPLETFFSKQALVEEHIQIALFTAIPGILTGLGLLMTFVAILDGLSHVSVSANMDVQGIGGLINGLSGKFVSSIVAVTCAVLFVFVERYAYAGPNRAYHRLVSELSPRFRRRTAEHLLFQIQSQLLTQSAVQKEFVQTLNLLQQKVGGSSGSAPQAGIRG